MSDRPCTCHPDDNPPRPCQQKYALSECRAAPPAVQAEPVAWRDLAYANLGVVRDQMQPSQVTAVQDWLAGIYPDAANVYAAPPAQPQESPIQQQLAELADWHRVQAANIPLFQGRLDEIRRHENAADLLDKLYRHPPAQPQDAALSAPPSGYALVPKVWLDAVSGFIPPGAMASLAAAPQPPAEPRERVLLMRSAEVGRWIQADGRSISGEYRYATLDPKEGEQT